MKRYPGIRPFSTDESDRFFGRDQDIERLWRLIRLEQVVILYGKSGYGKSSLLAAGIYPKLTQDASAEASAGKADKRYQHWEMRFGPYQPGQSRRPAEALRSLILHASPQGDSMALFPTGQFGTTFWQALKSQQGERKRFILFFDQFEEIFTYPSEQVQEFKTQLAEALYTAVPESVANATLGPEQEAALNEPFELKVVFAIRADRMSQLNALQDYLPNLLRHSYPLDALDEGQATEAVIAPALLGTDHQFDTPPFYYDPPALALIFKELRDPNTGKIETSALQIVCRHVEDNIVGPGGDLPGGDLTTFKKLSNPGTQLTIGPEDLGDIKSIFRQFYDRTIAALPEARQPAARHLVEDLLIKDGVRLPFAEKALLAEPGITPGLLQTLTAASLLRVERDEQGRMLYEVGHDTLVGPISEAAKARRELEEKERLQREAEEALRREEDALRREREAERKRRRALWLAISAGIMALLAIAASYLAYLKSEQARAAAEVITAQKKQVEDKTQLAGEKTREAAAALQRAKDKEVEAQSNYVEAQRQTGIASLETRRAREALRQAEAERQHAEAATADVVRSIIKEAQRDILHLDYATALDKLHAAAKLGQVKPEVARALLEIAFFYTQSGSLNAAEATTIAIARLLERNDLSVQAEAVTLADRPAARRQLAGLLRTLDADRCRDLEARYYLDMVAVPAGSFSMGSDSSCENCGDEEKPRHEVRLAKYHLARTETTYFQFALYAAAAGRKFTDFSPSWGLDGDNPAVNVSWFDAILYANWLSNRFALDSAYVVGEKTKGSYGDQYEVILRPEANGYRLPTEAEWEYAAKGGPAQPTFVYAGSDSLDLVGWYSDNSAIGGVRRTHPVGGKQANALGFFDLSGNVWEWCWDWYGEDYYRNSPPDNPIGPASGTSRLLRGGSWNNETSNGRVANRNRNNPDNRNNNYGFRLARDLCRPFSGPVAICRSAAGPSWGGGSVQKQVRGLSRFPAFLPGGKYVGVG